MKPTNQHAKACLYSDFPRVSAKRQDSRTYEERNVDQRPPTGGVPHRHY